MSYIMQYNIQLQTTSSVDVLPVYNVNVIVNCDYKVQNHEAFLYLVIANNSIK